MDNQATAQEELSQDVDPQDNGRTPNNQYQSLEKDQLLDIIARLDSKIHEVNNESKQRKLKLREFESKAEKEREESLRKTQEFETLYNELLEKTKDYEDLRSFKESVHAANEERLVELEKKLTAGEKEELSILSDLSTDKKLKWIEMKVKNRNMVDIDNSSSVQAGGSLKARPTNKRELALLSPQDVKKFMSQYPNEFKKAAITP
jgi:hypothetical protein